MDRSNNGAASGASSNTGSTKSQSSTSTIRAKSSTPSLRRVQTQPSKPTQPSQASISASATMSATNSAAPSPLPSREPSPSRPSMRTTASARNSSTGAPISRSRKNSQTDVSPARSTRSSQSNSTPSLPRTLSATSTPQLLPSTSDSTIRAPVPQKPSVPSEPSPNTPRWPVSPRLKSPPPVLGKPTLGYPPSISVQRSTPSPGLYTESSQPDSDVDDTHLQPGVRTPARTSSTALETVQEASPLGAAIEKLEHHATLSESQTTNIDPSSGTFIKSKPSLVPAESGSESGSIRAERRQPSTGGPPPSLTSRQSSTSSKLNGNKARLAESCQPNMIVETETVPSIPQGPVVPMPSNGSLRTKPSTETIRPKKEKKKANHKKPSVAPGTGEQPDLNVQPRLRHYQSIRSVSSKMGGLSPTRLSSQSGAASHPDDATSPRRAATALGHTRNQSSQSHSLLPKHTILTRSRTASSKADIFEANVATAVDEADDSDSEETFVYDSNPADARDRPQRFHSRTPSATSMVSQVDRNGMRSIHSVMEGATNPPVTAVKKNMKFVNTFSSGNESLLGDDEGKGTSGGRSNSGSGRGTARQHHHFNRHSGRNNNNNHTPSLFDAESPLFPINAARSKLGGNSANSRSQSSGPPSPKVGSTRSHVRRGGVVPSNQVYDLSETHDENTPLLNSGAASGRSSRRSRRNPMARRNMEGDVYRQPPSFLNRFAGCLVLTVMLMLVVSGAVGFMFATSQPLDDVKLVAIRNVIASEQELMFDMEVRAHNPNVVVVTVDSAHLEIFAKSPHAGRDSEWWRRPRPGYDGSWARRRRGAIDKRDSDAPHFPWPGFDDGDDPDPKPNMLLGDITELDNPLVFEGAFFHGGNTSSNGSVRLARPGNGTDGGSERWERILDDDFELLVQGTLSYSLPLSQRIRSAPIRGRAKVRGSEGGDEAGEGGSDVHITKRDSEKVDEVALDLEGGTQVTRRWWMGRR